MSIATPEIFGGRIRRERRNQELSYAGLAAKAGDSPTNLKRIESGTGGTSVFRAARIAAALGLSLDALLAPAECPVCDGFPPAGFLCPSCRKLGGAP